MDRLFFLILEVFFNILAKIIRIKKSTVFY